MTHTLKLFKSWQVTLPKSWRSKFETDRYEATENEDGTLTLRPCLTWDDDTVYYENSEWFGLYFPNGMDPEKLILAIQSFEDGDES